MQRCPNKPIFLVTIAALKRLWCIVMVEPRNYNHPYNQCGDKLDRRYQLAWTFSVLWCHQETP